jgi:hypothetical protein
MRGRGGYVRYGSCWRPVRTSATVRAPMLDSSRIRPVVSALALLLASLAVCGGVSAGGGERAVSLGVLGGRVRFDDMTGQLPSVGHVIADWGQGPVGRILDSLGPVPMLGVKSSVLAPREIALGKGDAYLAELNAAVAERTGLVYLRPLPEMNGHWNSYCAFDSDGSPRGVAYTTAWFRKAFARIYVLVHGGDTATVDGRLQRLGLPPSRAGTLVANPVSRLRVVWNPQGFGSPDLPGNSAAAYYPGDAYVDVVADDIYNRGGRAEWGANERLYDAHPSKPYGIGEWANWGVDDPSFIVRMAAFVRTHPRVELLAYFNGHPGSPWDLARQPRSRAAYRRLIVPLQS